MRKIILLTVAVLAAASCTRGLDEAAVRGGDGIRFVVGDFPAFGESSTRAVGTEDPGKTSWAEGDELLVELGNNSYGSQYATVTFNGEGWELKSGTLVYKEGDPAYVPHVYYAPGYEWVSGKLALKEGKFAGTDEFIEGTAQITSNGEAITVNFSSETRNYSRLRIATIPDVDVSVFVEYFTPAGPASEVSNTYTLHSDVKGNAYLYGSFVKNSTVSVKYDNVVLADYTFTGATTRGTSYALDATVISLEGKTEPDVWDALKKELDAGKTRINIRLEAEPNGGVFSNIQFGLNGAGAGTINLVLIGCEKIPAEAFGNNNSWLRSITLPDVTEIGTSAFARCGLLQKVEFGTPLTKVYGSPESSVFGGIFEGCALETIALVLSVGQKVMTGSDVGSDYVWTPGTSDYMDTDDHAKHRFIGYTFKSVTCGGTTH